VLLYSWLLVVVFQALPVAPIGPLTIHRGGAGGFYINRKLFHHARHPAAWQQLLPNEFVHADGKRVSEERARVLACALARCFELGCGCQPRA
jgi:hypothetical protein